MCDGPWLGAVARKCCRSRVVLETSADRLSLSGGIAAIIGKRLKPILPTDSEERKKIPLFSGPMSYFPRTMAAVAQACRAGNEKHLPGEPLRWEREKSPDHTDCILRHLVDAHEETATSPCGAKLGIAVDPETGIPEAAFVAWRALAHAELVLEHLASITSGQGEAVESGDPCDLDFCEWVKTRRPEKR